MADTRSSNPHSHGHAFGGLRPLEREGLVLATRRNFLKAGVAGLGGLSLPGLLEQRARSATTGGTVPGRKAVILLWMTGGPSQIDTWDPKPERPWLNRGPFDTIDTRLPGVRICEHLPKQAAMLDRLTILRAVDCRHSNHEPNTVFQTANLEAEPRINPNAHMYPAIGSIVAKHRGPNHPDMPPYVAFIKSRSHLAFGGYLGNRYDPFIANEACKLPIYDLVGKDTGQVSGADFFRFPKGLTAGRVRSRRGLLDELDTLRAELEESRTLDDMDQFSRQAIELLLGARAREAFDIEQEPSAVRERYGSHLWCRQALIARRLVEAGVSFVTIDLSYHTASGTWDNHGDNIPPYGGISKGLKPLLPLFDHLTTTLISDLEERGLLNDVLVLMMGEFGRTPVMGTQGSTDGRNHWPYIMSMAMAGGGLRHGQVIGASDSQGGSIKSRPVKPADLAATIYKHMGVPLDLTYLDSTNRPRYIVDGGEPIAELF